MGDHYYVHPLLFVTKTSLIPPPSVPDASVASPSSHTETQPTYS